jgi:allantoin racemase
MEAQSQKPVAVANRLLVINPNTNARITERVRQIACTVASPDTDVVVVNPDLGPFSIESVADRDAAVPRVVSLIRNSLSVSFSGYVLACFDDIGIEEARAMVSVPVVGTCEAGIAAARTLSRRFSIITTVHSAIPTIHGILDRYGARAICTVRAAGIGVAAAASGGRLIEEKIAEAVRAAIVEDGAEAILLGSGGLAGWAEAISRDFSIPVIDGVAAAIKMAEGLASLRFGRHLSPRRTATPLSIG